MHHVADVATLLHAESHGLQVVIDDYQFPAVFIEPEHSGQVALGVIVYLLLAQYGITAEYHYLAASLATYRVHIRPVAYERVGT